VPQVVVVDNDSGAVVLRHETPAYTMVLAADGQSLLVTRPDSGATGARWRVVLIDLRGGVSSPFADTSFDDLPKYGWTPDGRDLVAVGLDGGNFVARLARGGEPAEILRLNPGDATKAMGTSRAGIAINSLNITWTPDRKSLLLAGFGSDWQHPTAPPPPDRIVHRQFELDVNSRELRPSSLPFPASASSHIADSIHEWYAYVLPGQQGFEERRPLYAQRLASTSSVLIAPGAEIPSPVAWLRAPSRLVYQIRPLGGGPGNPTRIRVWDAQTGTNSDVTVLHEDEFIYTIAASVDGRRLLLVKGRVANAQLIELRA
jgi:dipeptidyl aminopeptidase/acylaminoacyl peptidase